MIGTKLAHYEITAHLGSGGMGDVYQATDLKLKRRVAIKLLPEAFSSDPERLSRFHREAEVLASLNHPNIGQIFGIEESGDKCCIVMELVEGETLQARIKRGPIPVDEALTIAKQICQALEDSHEKGVIHRDLKPGNVMLTSEEKVKVLDFGLAKILQPEVPPSDRLTKTSISTEDNVILGTVRYMSPEQARGKDVDKRADIWAWGCVLYEMLTGRRTFDGETTTDVIAKIAAEDPDWTRLPADTPLSIRTLLRRSLQKDPTRRLHDIADARIEIEERKISDHPVSVSSSRWPSIVWVTFGIVAGIVSSLVVGSRYRVRAVRPAEMRFEVRTPTPAGSGNFAISPDGRTLVFEGTVEGKSQLWLRPLNSITSQPLPDTEQANNPFWSPDSRSIGFFSRGKLKRIDLEGDRVTTIANAPANWRASWGGDNLILFVPFVEGPVFRVPAGGGTPAEVTTVIKPAQSSHRFPEFLPDGIHFLFFVTGTPEVQGVYIGALNSRDSKPLLSADGAARYDDSGYLLFRRRGALLAQQFDINRLELRGEPFQITSNLFYDAFSVSSSGSLAFREATAARRSSQLGWFDRYGKQIGSLLGTVRPYLYNPQLSPDGKRVAISTDDAGLLLIDTLRGTESLFRGTGNHALWTPNGERIIFDDSGDIYEKNFGDGAMEKPLVASALQEWAQDLSRDGRFLLYRRLEEGTGWDLWALPMDGDAKPIPVARTRFEERDGQFSPDGKWVVFLSNDTGVLELYIQPFPGPGAKVPVTANGAAQPRWSHDGHELFYISFDSTLMSVPITLPTYGTSPEIGSPTKVFPIQTAWGVFHGGAGKAMYDVSRDGRFLIDLAAPNADDPIVVVLNWNPHK